MSSDINATLLHPCRYNSTWLYPLVTAPLDTTVWAQFNGLQYAFFLAAANSTLATGAPVHPYANSLLVQYEAW